jgi:hypothetical protein
MNEAEAGLTLGEQPLLDAFRKLVYGFRPPARRSVRPWQGRLVETDEGRNEWQRVARVLRNVTPAGLGHLHDLFRLGAHVCFTDVAGNFVNRVGDRAVSTVVLAAVLRRFPTRCRLLYVTDSEDEPPEPSLTLADWYRTCSQLGIEDVVLTTTPRCRSIVASAPDTIGMVALVHAGRATDGLRGWLRRRAGQLSAGAVLQLDRGLPGDHVPELEPWPAPTGPSGRTIWFRRAFDVGVDAGLPSQVAADFMEDDAAVAHLPGRLSRNERFQVYSAALTADAGAGPTGRVLEIGSDAGRALLLARRALGKRLARVEAFAVAPRGTRPPPDVRHLGMTSTEAAGLLRAAFATEPAWASVVILDGVRSYEAVRRDLADYVPMVQPGGVVLLHPYLPHLDEGNRLAIGLHHDERLPGVRRAARELLDADPVLEPVPLPILRPDDLSPSQPHLPLIPGVRSTLRAYRRRS